MLVVPQTMPMKRASACVILVGRRPIAVVVAAEPMA
jgi:hypothetical protein